MLQFCEFQIGSRKQSAIFGMKGERGYIHPRIHGIGAKIRGIKDFCVIHIKCHYIIQDAYVSNMPYFSLKFLHIMK